MPVGFGVALTDKSISDQINYYLDLSYENSYWDGLNLTAKVYSNLEDSYMGGQIYPPGFYTFTPTSNPTPPPPLLPAIMPDGMVWENAIKAYRIGVEFQGIYKISDKNRCCQKCS